MTKKSNIKVLMIHDAWKTLNGGGQRHAQALAKELEVFCVNVSHTGPWHHQIIIRAIWTFLAPLWLWWKIRSNQIQILHAHGFHSVLTAKLISLLIPVKIVHTVHGSHLMDKGSNSLKTKLETWLLTKLKVDHQWSVTQSFIKDYKNINHPQFIGNGVDLKIFKPDFSKKSTTPKIIWVGRNDWSKGLDILKTIQEKLLTFKPDIFISTIIDGKLSQNQLAKKFQTAWIYLMTSKAEGLPLTILEAMACGLPVVSTNVGEIDSIVTNQTGRVFSPENPDEAVNAILEIIETKKLRNQLSNNAINSAQNYSWNQIAKITYKNYLSLLK